MAVKPYYRAVLVFLFIVLVLFVFYRGFWVSRDREEPAEAPVAKDNAAPPYSPETAETKSAAGNTPDNGAQAPALLPEPEPQNPESAVKDMSAQPESQSSSYTVLIASHRLADNVLREASRYRANGVDSHWVKVDLGEEGIWYRHFAGRFTGRAETLRFIQESGLAGARILAAPWAISVGEGMSREVIGGIADMLRSNQYDGYVQEMKNGGYRLLVGAFVTKEGAENAAREITLPGIVPKIVMR
ncbi:MAG: hypothetical protein KKE00_08190 [Proteobacteria bacterium]|nr:hypothetical protein [Pseudomonadota bacterium]MBU1398121.1 hypothetical protein [Pseudomonadota bacterium]MBU1570480.1 hypothetical protein [Pseudomonadota bacterium]